MTDTLILQDVGTKWFKCDLHLHTPASECFADRTVTAQKWVDAAIKADLDCVAVTDHNTGSWIDSIKDAAKSTSLTVFPGTEITCSDAKVHLLILFDVAATSQTVGDFLIRAGIDRKSFGQQDAKTNEKLQAIVELAQKEGALVIAAHIDEYNGICQAGYDIQKDFLKLAGLNGVQLVHESLRDKQTKIESNSELQKYFKDYYAKEVPIEVIKSWYKTAQLAIAAGNTILTFSDNPSAPQSAKHGIWGIGKRYSWIKMDQQPNLESLRHALLLPVFRVRCDFDSKEAPYSSPAHWVRQISVEGTRLNSVPISLNFSPQMTTIIGGPGSGKSSVFRCVRGTFGFVGDLESHPILKKEQDDFFKSWDKRKKLGVLEDQSKISVILKRGEKAFRVSYQDGDSTIEEWDNKKDQFQDVSDHCDLSDFNLEIFSQKQIFSIAQSPEALRERIDSSTKTIADLKGKEKESKALFKAKGAEIRSLQVKLANKPKLEKEIKELTQQIQSYEQSGYGTLTKGKELFSNEQTALNNFRKLLLDKVQSLEMLSLAIQQNSFKPTGIREIHRNELAEIVETSRAALSNLQTKVADLKLEAKQSLSTFDDALKKSEWNKAFQENQKELKEKKELLLSQGVNDLENFENLLQTKTSKEQQLIEIEKFEKQVKELASARQVLKENLFKLRTELCTARRDFLEEILKDTNVRMKVAPFRDSEQFHRNLREILQKDSGFDDDFEKIISKVFGPKADINHEIEELRTALSQIKAGNYDAQFGKPFNKVIEGLNDEQRDELHLILPEDDIVVEYRSAGSKVFKPLSSASPGQKTSAILTFILSYGTCPLLLDQPDDDVASNLIYDLIVERIREAKERRQLIVITHNANIPVNGDSEYILALDSGSRQMKLGSNGTIEQESIKKEICDVMEGGKEAFDMRSKRYSFK